MARYKLRTPTYDEALWTDNRLLIRYQLPRGITLVVSGDDVTEVTYPYQEDLKQYDRVYLGGRIHVVSQQEADVLMAAGYSDFLTPIGD